MWRIVRICTRTASCLLLVPTSLFHSWQRSPRSLAGPTSGEELLKGSWEDSKMDCDGTFHMFHQVLGWSSCLRSPTDRHAVVRPGWIVSPDSLCHLWFYYSSIITTSIALSIRTNVLILLFLFSLQCLVLFILFERVNITIYYSLKN